MEERKVFNCESTREDEDDDSYDAIVIGSGYGGSVAACRMSMAGIRVCLIEKGRRWESRDFPTDSFKFMSAVRMDMRRNLGLSFGAKDALFQIREQDDSVAVTACGLGGGSLVNAGVIVSTPLRARRNIKWPKEWEKDWELFEASASTMLGSQTAPIEFSSAKVMNNIVEEEIEESFRSSINLSINFGSSSSKGRQELGSCLACGNCLSGCPYNAKNSTDKNYLAAAIQAGCTVKTQCQVQYIVKNPDEGCNEECSINKKPRKRWRVYLNDIDYISSDFVIISAGVFGTVEILFHSQRRGLIVSERLGYGFSCNGNNVAYVAGSPAPLNAYGLDKKQFSKIPYHERPGPSISSSYTSSLGFSIQIAVLPVSFPNLLFKGIFTYGWPIGSWFLHGIIDKLKQILHCKSSQAMVLNAVGFDESDGRISFDKDTEQISFSPPQDPLLARKIQALQKLTKRIGGILFMSKYRSTSVHLLGGCNVAADHSNGVCNHHGQVFDPKHPAMVHPGLYVCDASLIPCSIGINPCLTITTVAEHVSRHLVQDILTYKNSFQPRKLPTENFLLCDDKHGNAREVSYPKKCLSMDEKLDAKPRETVLIRETMRGYIGGMPCTAYLRIKMNSKYKTEFHEQNQAVREPDDPLLRGMVGGYVVIRALEKNKLYIIDGEVDMCRADNRTPYTQYMHYHLILASASGSKYILEGRKTMNPFLLGTYAWRESTTLCVTLKTVHQISSAENVDLKGELNVSFMEFLRSLISLSGNKRGRFVCLFLQSLLRTYILQVPRGRHWDLSPGNLSVQAYPPSVFHEIQTEDGVTISCRQWKCNQSHWRPKAERQQNPVLLINGYSVESYCLPTEPKDLVRSLLDEGHETWLLEARLHPRHPSNNFTIEDIGKFDIPAAIKKIQELNEQPVKLHVVAHCVGGLAIHIALMGGHVSATQIASLCCSNSSMFFKLNAFSLLKMRLPIIPIAMAILGKDTILPVFKTSKVNLRQRVLKSIARLIPRYERCTCDECEVFSGIFGSSFWHENLSTTVHHWFYKTSISRLPMSAFPHLQRICNAGFIVDPEGQNKYLIHPERISVPTLYISGGRTLLVTPETSFLANQYMRLHQPGFRHTRVVIDGFGHLDLLMGEESYKKVFPHILSHIRLVEQGRHVVTGTEETKYSKEALSWSDDPFDDRKRGIVSSISPLKFFLCFLVLFLVLVSLLS